MAYPENMVYVRWEFGWVNGTADIEIQDFGLWGIVARDTQPSVFPEWQGVVDALALKAISEWAANYVPSQWAGRVVARRAIAYHYDQAHQNVLHRAESPATGANAWQGTGNALPPQISVAVTTQAFDPAVFTSQVRRKRGRFYLPTPAVSVVDDDGELKTTQQSNILAQSQAFFNALTGHLNLVDQPTFGDVRWRPNVSSVAGQFATEIENLAVGRIFDTQRRRRNKLPELYVGGPVNT